jgi:hypothetical protein
MSLCVTESVAHLQAKRNPTRRVSRELTPKLRSRIIVTHHTAKKENGGDGGGGKYLQRNGGPKQPTKFSPADSPSQRTPPPPQRPQNKYSRTASSLLASLSLILPLTHPCFTHKLSDHPSDILVVDLSLSTKCT